MASINTIQIKSLKTFKGHEGEPLYQGNIYYKGKKLGFWSQDSWGGYDNFDFNEDVLKDEVEKFRLSDFVEEQYKNITNIEILLGELTRLAEQEKMFKKYVKKGYPSTVIITDGYHEFYGACKHTKKEDILKTFDDYIKECKGKCYKNKKVKVLVYTDLKDFDVVV